METAAAEMAEAAMDHSRKIKARRRRRAGAAWTTARATHMLATTLSTTRRAIAVAFVAVSSRSLFHHFECIFCHSTSSSILLHLPCAPNLLRTPHALHGRTTFPGGRLKVNRCNRHRSIEARERGLPDGLHWGNRDLLHLLCDFFCRPSHRVCGRENGSFSRGR